MDIASTIIGLSALLVFTGPIFWMHWSQNRKKNKLLNDFKQKASRAGIQVQDPEVWASSYGIGFDPYAKKVFYLQKWEDTIQTAQIDLSEVAVCKVEKSYKKYGGDKRLVRVEMVFIPVQASAKTLALEIYDYEKVKQLDGELALSEKWVALINDRLKRQAV